VTNWAVLKGYLPRLSKVKILCVDCGKRAKHYDHRDYRLPHIVEPLCQSCNFKRGSKGVRWFYHVPSCKEAHRLAYKYFQAKEIKPINN